jgi:hydrogenase maturation factor
MAVTECFGQVREVSLLLMNEDVAVGDYLLIQAGGFAFERVDPACRRGPGHDAGTDGTGRRRPQLG